MRQDGFVQAGGTPDPSEPQRQDQKSSGHFTKDQVQRRKLKLEDGEGHRNAATLSLAGQGPEEVGMEDEMERGRRGWKMRWTVQAHMAGNPATYSIVPDSMGKGS